MFGIGIFATSVLTLLTPLAAHAGVEVLMAVRIIEGIFEGMRCCPIDINELQVGLFIFYIFHVIEGVTFPCIQDVWSRWCPPHERSRMSTISVAGTYAGTVIAMPLSGVLAAAFGWESLFYVFGKLYQYSN